MSNTLIQDLGDLNSLLLPNYKDRDNIIDTNKNFIKCLIRNDNSPNCFTNGNFYIIWIPEFIGAGKT